MITIGKTNKCCLCGKNIKGFKHGTTSQIKKFLFIKYKQIYPRCIKCTMIKNVYGKMMIDLLVNPHIADTKDSFLNTIKDACRLVIIDFRNGEYK